MRGKRRSSSSRRACPTTSSRAPGARARGAAGRRDPRQGPALTARRVRPAPGHRRPRDASWRPRRRRRPSPTRSSAVRALRSATRRGVRAVLPQPVAKRPPSFCTGCPERPVFSAMKILKAQEPDHRRHARGPRHRVQHVLHAGAVQRRQLRARVRHGARVRQRGGAALRQANDLRHGRRRLLAQRPDQRRRQRGLQQAGLRVRDPRQLRTRRPRASTTCRRPGRTRATSPCG